MKSSLPITAIFSLCFFLCLSLTSFSQLSCDDSALEFKGNYQYLKLAPNQSVNSNFLTNLTGDYTIECLIKWNGGADFQRIFDFSYGTIFFMFLTPSENANHVPRFAISATGLSAPQFVDANTVLTTGEYHHIAVTYSKANSLVTIFIDGNNAGSGTINIDADSIYYGNDMHDSSANYIGLSAFQGDPQFNADIDEFRISDTVRYANNFIPVLPFLPDAYTIVLHHFNDGNGQTASDASGNNYTAQLGSTIDIDDNDPTWVSCATVLATSLTQFTATGIKGKVQLNWQTASETNAGYFEIERSTDRIHFTTAGRVNASGSSNGNNYSFIDISPAQGNNYYRLKQVDRSGSYNYSNIIFIQLSGNSAFKIYPTITANRLHITVTQTPSTIIIYNTVGKPVKTISINNSDEDINVSKLPAGSYIIRNIATNSSLKFIKQ